MSLLSAFAQGFVNRVLQRSTAQGVVYLLNIRTNCGDNGGSNPVSDCLFWDTLRFLVVNVLGISQNIRFKAIFSPSVAFSILSWVAIPLKHIKRLESLKISLEKYIASPLIRGFWVKYTAFLKPLYSAFWILYTLAQWLSITLGF